MYGPFPPCGPKLPWQSIGCIYIWPLAGMTLPPDPMSFHAPPSPTASLKGPLNHLLSGRRFDLFRHRLASSPSTDRREVSPGFGAKASRHGNALSTSLASLEQHPGITDVSFASTTAAALQWYVAVRRGLHPRQVSQGPQQFLVRSDLPVFVQHSLAATLPSHMLDAHFAATPVVLQRLLDGAHRARVAIAVPRISGFHHHAGSTQFPPPPSTTCSANSRILGSMCGQQPYAGCYYNQTQINSYQFPCLN